MRRETFLILLGVLIVVAPFSGLPLSWLMWVLPIIGIIVIVIGVMFRRDRHTEEVSTSISSETVSL